MMVKNPIGAASPWGPETASINWFDRWEVETETETETETGRVPLSIKPCTFFSVVGARPNFVKAAPVMRALERWTDVRQTLVHTGRHFDKNLSDVFFSQLSMPEPDLNLEVGSGSHAVQTAEVMRRFEPVIQERKPDLVLVYGDVNSTVAAVLVCSKLFIRVGHVEAGLRSFDRTMPEEINRIVTDRLADLLFTPTEDADINLRSEGVSADKICRVGNVMIGLWSDFSRLPCNVPGTACQNATLLSRYIALPMLMTARTCGVFSSRFLK